MRAVITTGRGYTRAEWRELLSERTVVQDYGFGPERITIPTYGRVLASSGKLPRDAWPQGESVNRFVRRVLGPPPKEGDTVGG